MSEKETVLYTAGGEKLVSTQSEDSEKIEQLYTALSKLDNLKDNAPQDKDSYKTILSGTKESEKVKTLAAQFIPKHFKFFDDLQAEACEAMLDLVEEESIPIRKNAIKGITQMCKDKPQYVTQMADVLVQLLLVDDIETIVTESFLTLMETDMKAAIQSLVQYASNDSDKELRSKVISFLKSKVVYGPFSQKVLGDAEVEELIAQNLKPLLNQVEGEDLSNVLFSLRQLPRYKKDDGPRELLSLLLDHSSINLDTLDTSDEEQIQKLFAVHPLIMALARNGADQNKVFHFFVHSLLPKYNDFEAEVALKILQCVAESSVFANIDESKQALPVIYEILHNHLPLPEDEDEEPEFNFSFLEALFYAFHSCGSKTPGSLNAVCGIKIFTGQPDDDTGDYSEKFEDLKKRLSIFLKKTTELYNRYKKVRTEIPENASEEEREKAIEEKKQSSMRTRLLRNLQQMTKQLSAKKLMNVNSLDVSWKRPRKNRKRKAGGQHQGRSKFHRGNSGSRGGRGRRQGRRGGKGRRVKRD